MDSLKELKKKNKMANPTPYQPLYQFYDEIRPKPKVADKAKLKQISNINAMSQILSLVGQGVSMNKGANVAPIQDKVTPYVMQQNQLLQKQEMDEDMASRENLLRTMEKEIEYGVDQENIAKKNAISEDQFKRRMDNSNDQKALDREADAKYNAYYKLTASEQIAQDKKDAENKAKTDLKFVTSVKDGGNDVGLTATDINAYWGKIYNDPELKKIVLKEAPLLEVDMIAGKAPSDDFKMQIIEKLYPQIKGMYTPESVRSQGSSAPSKSTTSAQTPASTTSATPATGKKVKNFDKMDKEDSEIYNQAGANINGMIKAMNEWNANPKNIEKYTDAEFEKAFKDPLREIGMSEAQVEAEWKKASSN